MYTQKQQSDLSLHCLSFLLQLLDALNYVKTIMIKCLDNVSVVSDIDDVLTVLVKIVSDTDKEGI